MPPLPSVSVECVCVCLRHRGKKLSPLRVSECVCVCGGGRVTRGHVPQAAKGAKKKVLYASCLCVSSFRRGHANLLCILSNFSDVLPEGRTEEGENFRHINP